MNAPNRRVNSLGWCFPGSRVSEQQDNTESEQQIVLLMTMTSVQNSETLNLAITQPSFLLNAGGPQQ